MALKQSKLTDFLMSQARSVPDFILSLRKVDPDAANQLISKPLFKTRTTPVTVAVLVLTWASAKYGFGWDADTVNIVAVVVTAIISYIMRAITTQATAGLLKTPPSVPPNTDPPIPEQAEPIK